jgi:HAD superfamily hydrolase (TIGR01509 family)
MRQGNMVARNSIQCVIYDMDGLLLNTEPFYTEASQRIASRYGKVFDWTVKSQMIGKRAADSARIFTQAMDLPMTPEEYLNEREAVLESLFPQAEPMPGAMRLTEHLHNSGVMQAVATSSDTRHFKLKTSRHQRWFSIFDCLVIGDDPEIRHGKPAPDIFLITAGRMGVAPSDCLVLEDSPVGIAAARAAGMFSVAVPDPHLDSAIFAGADQILRSLLELDPAAWGLPPFIPDVML